MLLRCCLLAGLLLGQAVAVKAEDPAETLRAQIRRLVVQLDAPQKSQRDEAEQRLIDLGPSAADLLPPDDDDLPAEVRLRLDRVRAQFDRARTAASTQASSITLRGKNLPLADVLTAIEKQTGNHLVDDRKHFGQTEGSVDLDLDLSRMPFWPALDRILDQAGMTTYASGEPGLSLVSRSNSQRPRSGNACYAGAFRIEPLALAALRDLRNPTQDVLQVRLEASWEPRLRPIVLYAANSTVQAVDDQGANLKVSNPDSQLELNVATGMYQMAFPIDFALPSQSATHISLKGQLRAVLPGPVEEFRFERLDDVRRRVERRAGVSVALDEVRREQTVWDVRIRVTFDNPGTALESHRTWILDNEAWLESPKKERIAYGRLEPTRQSESEVGLAFLFAAPDDLTGYTFVYRTPSAITTVPVAWELKDLQLP